MMHVHKYSIAIVAIINALANTANIAVSIAIITYCYILWKSDTLLVNEGCTHNTFHSDYTYFPFPPFHSTYEFSIEIIISEKHENYKTLAEMGKWGGVITQKQCL